MIGFRKLPGGILVDVEHVFGCLDVDTLQVTAALVVYARARERARARASEREFISTRGRQVRKLSVPTTAEHGMNRR